MVTYHQLATKKIDFLQSKFLWMSTKLDPAIPLCNDCYKDSAFAVTPESKSRYVAKLIKKNLTKTNLLQLGFSVIDTPYSGFMFLGRCSCCQSFMIILFILTILNHTKDYVSEESWNYFNSHLVKTIQFPKKLNLARFWKCVCISLFERQIELSINLFSNYKEVCYK